MYQDTSESKKKNISFLVDLTKFDCWQDVKADMNGVFPGLLRSCTWTVEVDSENDVVEFEKKKHKLVNERSFHIYNNSVKNSAGLSRSIFLLHGQNGDIINSTCLLQYNILKEGCEQVAFEVPSHGNCKKKGKSFYPTKKSTMSSLKKELTSSAPVVAYKKVSSAVGGVLGARNPGELPRSKQQLYDLQKKGKKVDDVDELLQYAKHAEVPLVLEHHDVPEDLWILGKPHMTRDLSRFCTSDKLSHPISLDPTFNFGRYEVTPITYKHLFLKCKRTGLPLSFLGPTALHYSKQKSVYKKIMHAVCNSSPGLADHGMGFITDGEEALFSAVSEEMPHAVGLRCFRHFRQNCREKLHKIGIQQKIQQKYFLDIVFGAGSVKGILDAETSTELKSCILANKQHLDEEEVKLNGKKQPEFCSYLESNRKMMQKHMIASARK